MCSNLVQYWTQTKQWPKGYFKQDNQVRENLKYNSQLEEQIEESNYII